MGLQSKLFKGNPKLEACLLYDPAHVTEGAVGDHVSKIQKRFVGHMGCSLQSMDSAVASIRYNCPPAYDYC